MNVSRGRIDQRGASRRAFARGGASLGVGTLLAACGGGGGAKSVSPIEGVTPAGKVTYALWVASAEQGEMVNAQFRKFNEAHPKLQVEVVSTLGTGPYYEKVFSMLSGGTPPEVVTVDGRRMPEFVERGITQRLDGYLASDRELSPEAFVPGSFLEGYSVFKGTYHAVPNGPESPRVIFFNKRRFAEVGAPLPSALEGQGKWTWDAYVETTSRLSQGTPPDRSYGTRDYTLSLDHYSWIFSGGGTTLSDDFKRCVMDRPETMAALQFQADLMHKHRVAPVPGDSLGAGDRSSPAGWACSPAGYGRPRRF